MPKKFKGENSKAVEAKARKASQKAEEADRKAQAAEDARWEDDDKHVMRKQQRKDDKERRRVEGLERKKEQQKLLDEEMASMKSPKPEPSAKVTRAEIDANRKQMEKLAAEQRQVKKQTSVVSVDDMPLEDNVNRLETEGEARNVEDAISVLSVKEAEAEKHPEKRVKAAYQAYEDINLPILKRENPNLRLSQLKQMLRKDWMKSPENPMNQRSMSYNIKK